MLYAKKNEMYVMYEIDDGTYVMYDSRTGLYINAEADYVELFLKYGAQIVFSEIEEYYRFPEQEKVKDYAGRLEQFLLGGCAGEIPTPDTGLTRILLESARKADHRSRDEKEMEGILYENRDIKVTFYIKQIVEEDWGRFYFPAFGLCVQVHSADKNVNIRYHIDDSWFYHNQSDNAQSGDGQPDDRQASRSCPWKKIELYRTEDELKWNYGNV